jgi:hypothetical protein
VRTHLQSHLHLLETYVPTPQLRPRMYPAREADDDAVPPFPWFPGATGGGPTHCLINDRSACVVGLRMALAIVLEMSHELESPTPTRPEEYGHIATCICRVRLEA